MSKDGGDGNDYVWDADVKLRFWSRMLSGDGGCYVVHKWYIATIHTNKQEKMIGSAVGRSNIYYCRAAEFQTLQQSCIHQACVYDIAIGLHQHAIVHRNTTN